MSQNASNHVPGDVFGVCDDDSDGGDNKTRVLLCKRLSGQCIDVYMVVYFHLHWRWRTVVDCAVLYWAVCAVLGCTWLFWNVLDCIWLYWAVLGCGGL